MKAAVAQHAYAGGAHAGAAAAALSVAVPASVRKPVAPGLLKAK
jgi:hypothetical protein